MVRTAYPTLVTVLSRQPELRSFAKIRIAVILLNKLAYRNDSAILILNPNDLSVIPVGMTALLLGAPSSSLAFGWHVLYWISPLMKN